MLIMTNSCTCIVLQVSIWNVGCWTECCTTLWISFLSYAMLRYAMSRLGRVGLLRLTLWSWFWLWLWSWHAILCLRLCSCSCLTRLRHGIFCYAVLRCGMSRHAGTGHGCTHDSFLIRRQRGHPGVVLPLVISNPANHEEGIQSELSPIRNEPN